MRASKSEVPVADEGGGYEGRFAEWDGHTVSFETIPEGTDFTPYLVGLPDDACHCPHWGFCFAGRFVVRYTDGAEETIEAGDAYFMRPGHRPSYLTETQTVEFSPSALLEQVMEVVARNMGEPADEGTQLEV